MAVITRTIVEATCDRCHGEIQTEGRFIDATVYGAAFHVSCWAATTGPELAKHLCLDDIRTRHGEDSKKTIYA